MPPVLKRQRSFIPQGVGILRLLGVEEPIVDGLRTGVSREELKIVCELTIQSNCRSVVCGVPGAGELVDGVVGRIQSQR
jgi:hypothetical protein